ncbi:MAG: phytanoyl-CoA dioxygenase family protein [Candidatus Latescibacterota bacterium]|nr:phytanoyl-CoA dioxygenase family protein [Candidatus Latescibacterota bacterium]
MQFEQEGYLLVRGLLDADRDLRPVFDEYGEVLDRLARQMFDDSEILSAHEELPFSERFTACTKESGRILAQHFDCSLPQAGTTTESPIWVGPRVFWTLRNERLLDVVEDLVGPEIYSNPVQHIRIKPPQWALPESRIDPHIGGAKGGFDAGVTPWHQDNGVVLPEADETNMLTVWFPLTRATVKNGCLQVIPRSHRDGILHHCRTISGLEVPDRFLDLDNATPMPMEPGDVLFLTRRTCHASLPNQSDDVRISFDIRYNPIGQNTGREIFPGFVARSRANPHIELRDPAAWARSWHDARERLAVDNIPHYNRWRVNDGVCA